MREVNTWTFQYLSRWRECKEKEPSLYSIKETESEVGEQRRVRKTQSQTKMDAEVDDRRQRNRAWREKREHVEDFKELGLLIQLLPVFFCSGCQVKEEPQKTCQEAGRRHCFQEDLSSGLEVYQCEGRHSFCKRCLEEEEDDGQVEEHRRCNMKEENESWPRYSRFVPSAPQPSLGGTARLSRSHRASCLLPTASCLLKPAVPRRKTR